uniref:Uncharacterized protein n=1 Tax=Steinernema glaseri TaxID=37863 RepID=A0A1I7Z3P8_9BILA
MDELRNFPEFIQRAVRAKHPFIVFAERRFREVESYDLVIKEKLEHAKTIAKRPRYAKERTDSEDSGMGSGNELVKRKRLKRTHPAKKRIRLEPDEMKRESEMEAETDVQSVDMPDMTKLNIKPETEEQMDQENNAVPTKTNRPTLVASRSLNVTSSPAYSTLTRAKLNLRLVTHEARPLPSTSAMNSEAFTRFRSDIAEPVKRRNRSPGPRKEEHFVKRFEQKILARTIPSEEELTSYEVRILHLYKRFERLLVEDTFLGGGFSRNSTSSRNQYEEARMADDEEESDLEFGG